MPPTPDDPLQLPLDSDSDSSVPTPAAKPTKSPLDSISRLPYRRSNASLSNLFASTTSLPTQAGVRSSSASGTVTPPVSVINGSAFSPPVATVRSPSPAGNTKRTNVDGDTKDLIRRSFSPHVSVLASADTDELVRHKGIHGGLLELLRPFGEQVQGKVTIRDSTGASRSWEDFGVRFTGVKDGLESPRSTGASRESGEGRNGQKRTSLLEFRPARLRSGGDVPQIEDLLERHLTFAEEQSGPVEADYLSQKNDESMADDSQRASPFYLLYLRRLLSGLPVVPSETISHPVASVIAISSRSQSPIEELRNLYASSNTGENRLPHWVHNEFLRYYLFIHDEDFDDIQKSMALYEQMKRHFGLHCHLLRLRSTQCVSSDDEAFKLPQCAWMSATEELAEIVRRETNEDVEDPGPYILESDAGAIRAFVRELVTQSLIPSMERASATWNDQVASRRRGISGRFMSLSKRFTAFGGARTSSGPSLGGAGSNYDALQGFYRPDAPEAVMRRLADYSLMLRDYKLAQSTFDILCQDFKTDKAWRHYAAANEMAAVSALMGSAHSTRVDTIDQLLETAYYSYITRVGAPYNALRTLLMGVELLKLRGGHGGVEGAARWASKILDDRLVGPIGHVLLMERIAACYKESQQHRSSSFSMASSEDLLISRKAGFWNTLACDAWLRLDKGSRAEHCLNEAIRFYGADLEFDEVKTFLAELETQVNANRAGPHHLDGTDLLDDAENAAHAPIEPLQGPEDTSRHRRQPSIAGVNAIHAHRKSLSVNVASPALPPLQLDPLGATVPTAYQDPRSPNMIAKSLLPVVAAAGEDSLPSPDLDRKDTMRDDGFE